MTLETVLGRYGYGPARRAFRAAAEQSGYGLTSHRHPTALGPGGEELTIDVARWSPADATGLLVVLSGVHGVEGLAGSVCQHALLARGRPRGRVAILLAHAVNPYGFAHLSRTNEGNVDLNRNGLQDFDAAPPADDYAALHDRLIPETWSESANAAERDLSDLMEGAGVEAFQAAVSGGQFDRPDGLFYGGCAPQWSRRIIETLSARAFKGMERVTVVDVHTGLGAPGVGELIYTGARTDPELAVTRARLAGLTVTCPDEGASVSAPVAGPLVDVFRRVADPGVLAAVALEFGVRDLPATLNALRGEAWLRRHPKAPAALAAAIRAELLEAFFSADPGWLEAVTSRFLKVADVALEGLA